MTINDSKIYLRICKSGLTCLQMPSSIFLDRSKAELGTSLLSITPTRQAVVYSLILASPASSKVGFDKSVRLCHVNSHQLVAPPVRSTGTTIALSCATSTLSAAFTAGSSQAFQDSSACTYHRLRIASELPRHQDSKYLDRAEAN